MCCNTLFIPYIRTRHLSLVTRHSSLQTMTSLLAISGSLRKASFSTALLRTAQTLVPEGHAVEIFDLSDIPLFNQDLESEGIPASVQTLKDRIEAADGVLVSTPEYSRGIPGVLKNAIDWISRGPVRPLTGKPTLIMSASPSPFGAIRAQSELRLLLTVLGCQLINSPELAVAQANLKFNENGEFIDETGLRIYSTLLTALTAKIDLDRRIKQLV